MNYTKLNLTKVLIYGAIVIFMSQLNALVDLFVHPEIPYLDREHIIVGTVTGLFTLLIGIVIFLIIRKIERNDVERERLLKEFHLAKEKAEESDQLKSAFLANMSHEIRTPMNGILGFTELLELTNPTDEQKQYLEIIKKSGQRLLTLINNIIDLSKIEAGQVDVVKSSTDLKELMYEIYSFFYHEAEKKGLNLTFDCDVPENKSLVETDREKIYAILVNLTKNALKFTDEGEIKIGCFLKDGNAQFYITDTGIGIPTEKQNDIFKRFIQANNNDKIASQGSGLGLAISKSYVKILGGKIWLESEPQKGSTFYFTVPV